MAKWIHPEAGEVDAFPEDEKDAETLRGMGWYPASEHSTQAEESPKPRNTRVRK